MLSNRKAIGTFEAWTRALQAVLGFECFLVTSPDANGKAAAAGTTTIRNPSYLLSKLKLPNALDDPQFLPLIGVANALRPELFYHYRQYRLSLGSPISLLLYPACSLEDRSQSFRIINWLSGGISDFVDPRTHERSLRLCEGILRPILLDHEVSASPEIPIEIMDIGAGSGSLTASLCRHLVSLGESEGFEPKFRLWFVGLEPTDPARFFHDARLRPLVDSLTFVGEDYRRGHAKHYGPPNEASIRVALVSKLLNNLSYFSIRPLRDEEASAVFLRARPLLDLPSGPTSLK